jgi:hypothetical protein
LEKRKLPWVTINGAHVLIGEEEGGGSGGVLRSDSSIAERSKISQEYGKSLSDDEKASLRNWGRSGRELRDIQSGVISNPTQEQMNTLRNFESAIDKAPRYEGKVYRGLSEVPRETVYAWESSGEITLANHQSSTTSPKLVEEYAQHSYRGKTVLLEIESKNGKHLLDNTEVFVGGRRKSESEVVLKKGTRYSVKSEFFAKHSSGEYRAFNRKNFPDYYDGSGFTWDRRPPNEGRIDEAFGGYFKLSLKEKP